VLLPDITLLSAADVKVVEKANWYEVWTSGRRGHAILAGAKAIKYLSEDDPLDAGIDLNARGTKVMRIADSLKRWSEEDGFYHA